MNQALAEPTLNAAAQNAQPEMFCGKLKGYQLKVRTSSFFVPVPHFHLFAEEYEEDFNNKSHLPNKHPEYRYQAK